MCVHGFASPNLCRPSPSGGIQVGVSRECVMGLNQNHGQKILLRLRTDDLKGFRKVGAVVGWYDRAPCDTINASSLTLPAERSMKWKIVEVFIIPSVFVVVILCSRRTAYYAEHFEATPRSFRQCSSLECRFHPLEFSFSSYPSLNSSIYVAFLNRFTVLIYGVRSYPSEKCFSTSWHTTTSAITMTISTD